MNPGALARAMDEMDEPAAQAALDRLLADFTAETVLRDAVLPTCTQWASWERGGDCRPGTLRQQPAPRTPCEPRPGMGKSAIGQQRCSPALPAKNMTSRCWLSGSCCTATGGASATSARTLHSRTWTRTAAELQPELSCSPPLQPSGSTVWTRTSRLTRIAPLALAGAGATRALADAVGAHLLDKDPVTAAEQMPAPRQPSPEARPPGVLAAGESLFG